MSQQVDYKLKRSKAHNMIKKYGSAAALRSPGVADRACWAFISNYNPIERVGKLIEPIDRKALVSPLMRDDEDKALPTPDREKDVLVTFKRSDPYDPAVPLVQDEILRMRAPPGKFDPGGIVLYWELQVYR